MQVLANKSCFALSSLDPQAAAQAADAARGDEMQTPHTSVLTTSFFFWVASTPFAGKDLDLRRSWQIGFVNAMLREIKSSWGS